MSNVLVIAQAGSTQLPNYQAQLQRVTEAQVYGCLYDELSIELDPNTFTITDHHNNRLLDTYDMVLFRGSFEKMFLLNVVCQYLSLHSIPYVNDYRGYKTANKLLQLVEFYKYGMPFPRTLFSLNSELLLRISPGVLGYPFVLKAVAGSKGHNNFRLDSLDAVSQLPPLSANTSFVAQAYIPNDYDYRILFIGQESIVVKRTGMPNSHLNNVSQGATIQRVGEQALPATVMKQAAALILREQLSVAGVDVVIDKKAGQPYFLEVNMQPGWGTLEAEVEPLLRKLLDGPSS